MPRIALLSIVVLCLVFIASYKYLYPFGHRSCTLPCMHSALLAYAAEHYGSFPESNKGSYDAIEKLYPEFTPSGIELAGVSGNIELVIAALREKTPLNQSLTSWIYLPGFKNDDDPNIAILWESRGGLYPDGRRNFFGGHAALFIRGNITNVPAADWERFLKHQEKLRNAVQTKRAARTNAPKQLRALTR